MGRLNYSLIIILLLSVTATQISADIYTPSFPTIAHYFVVPISKVQLTLFIHSLGISIGGLVYGPFSDRYGRKAILIISLTIAFIGSLVCLFSKSIEFMFIGRLIQGFGFGYTGVIRAILRDIEDNPIRLARLVSVLGVTYALFAIFGPIVGGYIEHYAFWRLDFLFLVVYAGLILSFYIFKFKNTNKPLSEFKLGLICQTFFEICTHRQFVFYNIISALTFAGTMAYITKAAYLLEIRLHLLPVQFGYTYILFVVMGILGNFINMWIVARRSRTSILKISSIMIMISGAVLLISGYYNLVSLWLILSMVGVYAFFSSFIYGNAMAGAMHSFKDKAGTAGGVFSFIQNGGAALGSALISIVPSDNQTSLGGLLFFFSLIELWLIRLIINDEKKVII